MTVSSASITSETNSGSIPSMTMPSPERKNGSSISCTLLSRARIPSRRAICESSTKVFRSSPGSLSCGRLITFLKRLGIFFMFSIGKPVKRQEIVPQMMIRNAAGLFKADKGAPLMTIPTKIEIKPMIRPTIVDVSKTSPLLFAQRARKITRRGSLRPAALK